MKVFIYRLSYTLLALSLVFFVYAVNKDLTLNYLVSKLEYPYVSQWLNNNIPSYVSYILPVGGIGTLVF